MKKNILVFFLLLSTTIACGQKKIETITLSNGKTIVIYDNKTWAYIYSEVKPGANGVSDTPKTTGTNTSGNSNNRKSSSNSRTTYSSTCGAPTKKGGACQRRVSGGGRCWQH
jgi:hypothetical protein